MIRPVIAALLLAACLPGMAMAQNQPAPRPQQRPASPAPTEPAPPPELPPPVYEKDLMRLAEIMGSLSFLSELCAEADAETWRRRMQTLVETEGATQPRRERLAGAFNKGYRGFAVTYRACTDSARAAIDLYVAEGSQLSRAITNRYGG